MRIHHLDCCTMSPRGRSAINGEGRLFARARLVSHCLLIETDAHGLVLVDTRIGVEDVLHIVLRHPDFDHAGGLRDFPKAKVHVHATGRATALARGAFNQKQRYRSVQCAHSPAWETYAAFGEACKGVPAVRQLEGLPAQILAVPLGGHFRGHAAIRRRHGPRLARNTLGDAYFHRSVMERGETSRMPWALRVVERLIAFDYKRMQANHASFASIACRRDGLQLARPGGVRAAPRSALQ